MAGQTVLVLLDARAAELLDDFRGLGLAVHLEEGLGVMGLLPGGEFGLVALAAFFGADRFGRIVGGSADPGLTGGRRRALTEGRGGRHGRQQDGSGEERP